MSPHSHPHPPTQLTTCLLLLFFQKLSSEIADIAEVLLKYQQSSRATREAARAAAAEQQNAAGANTTHNHQRGAKQRLKMRREAVAKARADATASLLDLPEPSARKDPARPSTLPSAPKPAASRPREHKRPEGLKLEAAASRQLAVYVYVIVLFECCVVFLCLI